MNVIKESHQDYPLQPLPPEKGRMKKIKEWNC
jgi:hypothetical protein